MRTLNQPSLTGPAGYRTGNGSGDREMGSAASRVSDKGPRAGSRFHIRRLESARFLCAGTCMCWYPCGGDSVPFFVLSPPRPIILPAL